MGSWFTIKSGSMLFAGSDNCLGYLIPAWGVPGLIVYLHSNCVSPLEIYLSIQTVSLYSKCVTLFKIYHTPQNVSHYLKYITLLKLYITAQNMSHYSKLYFTDQNISHYSKMYPLLKMSHTASKYITLL